jgi:carbon-monoxide dehydrogenase medium subunit
MKHDLLRYEHLIDLKTIPGLNKIEAKNGALIIGGGATHRAIENSAIVKQQWPVLAAMEANVGNVRVRASGTLAGNLCFAEPHSDAATLLMTLGAKVQVQGKGAARSLTIEQLITGAYETSLATGELMLGVEVPPLAKSQRAAYLKYQLKERPTLGMALVLDVEGDQIIKASAVVGSVSAAPTRSDKADALLAGTRTQVEKRLSEAAEALAQAADPVDDLEGSAEYKRHLIGVFLKRAFAKALS